MDDLIERARHEVSEDRRIAALMKQERNREVMLQRARVTEDLIAEIEQLRAGGAWNEHVQYQLAMKRQRDGECICNTGPDIDGPDEFCPWHGRRYTELVDIIVQQQSQLNGLSPERNVIGRRTMTHYAGQSILCCHDYPTYIDSGGNIRCDECDRVVGLNH